MMQRWLIKNKVKMVRVGLQAGTRSLPSIIQLVSKSSSRLMTTTVHEKNGGASCPYPIQEICEILDIHASPPAPPPLLAQLLQPYLIDMSPMLVSLVIQQQKSLPQALNFFHWASQILHLDEDAHHALLYKLGEFKHFADMWRLLEHMKRRGLLVSSRTLSIIMKAYGFAGMPLEAIEVFRKAHEFGVVSDVNLYTTILSVLFKGRMIVLARHIYRQAMDNGCIMDDSVWATLIRGFGKNGFTKEAEECWDQMIRRGLQPKVVHYNALIEGFCESKLLNKALFTLMAIKEHGFKPNPYSFNPVLETLCKAHRYPEAMNIFLNMGQTCPLNQATCNILLEGLFFNADIQRACELFEIMVQEEIVDHRSYTLLTSGLKKAQQRDKLLSLCRSLHTKHHGNVDNMILNALLHCLCEDHSVNEAMDFFKGLKNPNLAAYAMMINCLCKACKMEEAMMLLGDMDNRGCRPNRYCYSPLIGAFLRFGRLVDGLNLFQEMVRNGVEPNDVICGSLLSKLSEAGMADGILLVYKHVVENKIAVSNTVLDLSVKCLQGAGKAEEAAALSKALARQRCFRTRVPRAS